MVNASKKLPPVKHKVQHVIETTCQRPISSRYRSSAQCTHCDITILLLFVIANMCFYNQQYLLFHEIRTHKKTR